jgi:AhpD family alkylhydroperoxidase
MSRIGSAIPGNANPLVRFTAWQSRRMMGRVPDPVAVTAHHPLLLGGYGALELALEHSHAVDRRVKGLAELKTAAIVGCEFCLDIGSMVVRRSGATERQLLELADYRRSDAFSDDEKLALEYAEAMSSTPAVIPDDLFERLRARWDERQLVELTSAIALENYRARFNHAFGLGAQGFSEGAVCARPDTRTSSAEPVGSVPGT